MYTIIMNQDKSLTTSIRATLYQGENLVDKIQFLFPEYYENTNLSECIAILKYVDQGNVYHTEKLAKDSELYKGKLRYVLPIDTKLSKFAGNVIVRVSFMKINIDTLEADNVLKTGECILTFLPDGTINYSVDVTEKLFTLQEKLEKANESIDELKATKGDNLYYDSEKNELQLKAQDESISSILLEECECEDGIPSIDFDKSEESDNQEVNNIVEF